jgi:hypothetical protein
VKAVKGRVDGQHFSNQYEKMTLSYFFRRVSKINIYKQCKTRLDEDQCEVKGFQRIYDAPEADKEGAN